MHMSRARGKPQASTSRQAQEIQSWSTRAILRLWIACWILRCSAPISRCADTSVFGRGPRGVPVWIAARPLSPIFLTILPVSLGILVSSTVYGLMRLVVYGKLSQSILGGSAEEFRIVCNSSPTHFPHAQVASYGNHYFEKHNKGKWWYRLYGKHHQPSKIILTGVFVVTSIMSYWLVS